MATPTNAADETNAAPDLDAYINLANYVYNPGNKSTINDVKQAQYKPLLYNGKVVFSKISNDGFYGEAFISTNPSQSSDVIVAFQGTNLKHSPSPAYTYAQIKDDHDILEGTNPQAYTDALTFTQTAIADAEASSVAAGNIYLDGHSLGAAEAEYVAAKLNLPGTTFGAPGIPSTDFAGSAPSKLTNYVETGDPVGNYAADSPQALGTVVQNSSILHYGTPVYTGASAHQKLLTNIATAYGKGTIASKALAAGEFAYGFAKYHQLKDYAYDLGLTIGDDNSAGSDVGFFSSLVGSSAAGSSLLGVLGVTESFDAPESSAVIACFASGTHISTARGSVAVETVSTDDWVITASGERRPVRWIGHRSIDCRRHPRPRDVWPIRIAAHAFGHNRPVRDLYVSPGHAICVDVGGEVLIPAGELVNGTSVRQVEVDDVTYWHVELESHDILLAEDQPAESYLDMGNRGFFRETGIIDLAAGPDAAVAARSHADFCRPFHDAGPIVDAVRSRIGSRATRARRACEAA